MADDILFLTWHMSGGNNVNPDMSIGGPPSPIQISPTVATELFSPINYIEAEEGKTKYRCVYLKNNSVGSEIKNARLWLETTDLVGKGQHFELGFGGFTEDAQMLSDETVAPVGVQFVNANEEANGLQFDFGPGQTVAIWIKNVIQPKTEYFRANMNFRLRGSIYL